MEDKILKDIPPSYTNLGYDTDPVAGPSAPRIESDPAPAYDVPGTSNVYPQPTAPLPDLNTPGPRTLVHDPPSLVFENIYDACIRHADKHCCYGKRFINQMKLTEIHNRTVYHYRLESHGEKRESTYRTTPYKYASVDGPENGPVPDPWDMIVSPPTPFQDGNTEKYMPHSESVHDCSKCHGSGKVTCYNCGGSGKDTCSTCWGSGKVGEDNNERCPTCRGSKEQRCFSCSGTGKRTCSRCDGYGKVKKYKVLIVTWKNHPTDSVTSTDQLPSDLILHVQGVELLRETANELQPITNADPAINSISSTSLQAHRISFHNELIIKQKHVLRAIPFTRVKYKWKEREGEFYIYGSEEKVYFEDYPQKCCCCTIC